MNCRICSNPITGKYAKEFCSKSCSNRSRKRTEESKQRTRDSVNYFFQTEKGLIARKKISELAKKQICTEETKKKISESVKASNTPEVREAKRQRMTGTRASPEKRAKMSRIAKDRNFGGHTSKKRIYFQKKSGEEVYLQSSYEIRFAEILECLDIDWERPDPLIWFDESGNDHKYYPDFKIGNIYIDTKNDYLIVKDQAKVEAVRTQNKIDLRIVSKEQINEEYVGSLV